MNRILVAYDGSPASSRALEHATGLIGDGELLLVHVLDSLVPEGYDPADIDPVEVTREADELHALADDLSARGLRVRALPVAGDAFADPVSAILAVAAEHQVTMIAVGSRGHGALARLAMGSVSTRLAHESHCDVFIVR